MSRKDEGKDVSMRGWRERTERCRECVRRALGTEK